MSVSSFNQPIPQISVQELASRMADAPAGLQLIDVREPEELAIAQIDGFMNLPLSQFAVWSEQIQTHLDPTAETIVLCHHGIRSAQMCQWLQQQGFTQVRNVVGGIEAYAVEVDSTIPRY
ncbi:MAG: rhodanese-related sulfurtransferase [Synechococcales cyanobacterium C42_A2020_086]|nr:rhodanese-related sulfurtransferase [Synechococcales cyanobacterium M58_A2018_015]MBF2073394.1 rhodanese-related sulfurtransferase [Synechococcales cyanobacterium C42_A2020_086]